MRLYAAFRLDALDLVDRLGLASPDLTRQLRQRLTLLSIQLQELANTYLEFILSVASDYARRSLALLRQVEPSLPSFEQLNAAIGLQQREIAAAFVATAAEFIEMIAARFTIAIGEAREQADDPLTIRRLFSPDLVDGYASVYRHGSNTLQYESQRKLWTVAMALTAAYWLRAAQDSGAPLQKQAVATVDKRTTKCCLRVHGQIKDIGEPFELSREPCGSAKKMHPPFPNHQCRTVESPYLPALELTGLTTDEMEAAARRELANRK